MSWPLGHLLYTAQIICWV